MYHAIVHTCNAGSSISVGFNSSGIRFSWNDDDLPSPPGRLEIVFAFAAALQQPGNSHHCAATVTITLLAAAEAIHFIYISNEWWRWMISSLSSS
mmetsp:Transcript_27079/g.65722  ORF Transcript_27079/g.65722 Transcript_27079/m.65722 type:complete len:95 (+) Transcript_27079:123-407(+)